jgi:hypothetical protein
MSAPQIGDFIRPVPSTSYCYQVLKVHQGGDHGPECISCKRFGYDHETQRPVEDGHQDTHYLSGLKKIMDGVWKYGWELTPRWLGVPLYWRKMRIDDVKRAGDNSTIQLSLF